MHDVVIDEERIRQMYLTLHGYADKVEERYKRYIAILKWARLTAMRSGAAASALSAYTRQAEKLIGQFDYVATDFEELEASFVREVHAIEGKSGI